MKKAKIYKPSKTAMQSGLKKFDKWIIEFITEDPGKNPLMGWESSSDTYSELNLEFKSKDLAIEYAKKIILFLKLLNHKKEK
jgi:NADH dehydrogenase (ubiquinone) Fe-S protein 4